MSAVIGFLFVLSLLGDFFGLLSAATSERHPEIWLNLSHTMEASFAKVLPFLEYGISSYLAMICVVLLMSRLSRPRVFVSYPLEQYEEAKMMAAGLYKLGIVPLVKQPSEYEHDVLLDELRALLISCHTLVLLPGARESFSSSEVFAATAMKKPVIIVRTGPNESLPNTAFSGYPVFSMRKLADREFRPLAQLINLAVGHWSARFKMAARTLLYALMVAGFVIVAPDSIQKIVFFFSPDTATEWYTFLMSVSGLTTGLAFYASLGLGTYFSLRVAHLCRQKIVTRAASREELIDFLSPLYDGVCDCLEKDSLPLRHSRTPEIRGQHLLPPRSGG